MSKEPIILVQFCIEKDNKIAVMVNERLYKKEEVFDFIVENIKSWADYQKKHKKKILKELNNKTMKFQCQKCSKEFSVTIRKNWDLLKDANGYYEWIDSVEEESLPSCRNNISCSCGSRDLEIKGA